MVNIPPLTTLSRHVEYVLVAEFDIDKGASLAHQYPEPTGADEHFLAELMLPDGAHLREEDWTVFFLNQKEGRENQSWNLKPLTAINDEFIKYFGEINDRKVNESHLVIFSSRPLLQLWGWSYFSPSGEWTPMSPSTRVIARLDDFNISLYDESCAKLLHEISFNSDVDYRQVESCCIYLLVDHRVLVIRFESSDDEFMFLNAIENPSICNRRYRPNYELPPAPIPKHEGTPPPLLYTLSLVRTKLIPGVKRGALVKAMAIATRHQWIQVFKPLLVLALEKYLQSGDVAIVQNLYRSINSMDLSAMPRLSMDERKILRASEDKNMFEERFWEMEERAALEKFEDDAASGINHGPGIDIRKPVESSYQQLQPSSGSFNGTGDRSTSGGSAMHIAPAHAIPRRIADTKLQRGNSNAASFSSNGRKSSIASSLSSKNTAKTHKDRQFFETKIGFDGIMVPVRIPLTMLPEEVGEFSVARLVSTFSIFPTPFPQPPSSVSSAPAAGTAPSAPPTSQSVGGPNVQYRLGAPYYWHPHLDTGPTTPALVVLVNAILTQKRVLFLGHGKPAGEVMNFVLSACAIAGGGALLRGFTERCFPYIGLQGLDLLLSTPGYIAGVTNPVFEEQTSWWDVLCNINTGKVMVSPKIEPAPPPAAGQPSDMGNTQQAELYDRLTGSWEPDIDLIQDATTSIGAHVAEVYIRQKFYDYVHRVVEVAGSLEQELFGQTSIGLTANDFGGSQIAVDIGIGTFFPDSNSRKREISFLRNRIEGWRATRSYVYLQKDFQSLVRRRAFRTTDVRHAISRLRFGQYITDSNTLKIYLGLQDVLAAGSDLQISEFLTYVPQASGGLFPIAMGLLHPRWEVRRAACRIMARLDWHKVGNRFIAHLNPFIRAAYEKACRLFLESVEDDMIADFGAMAVTQGSSYVVSMTRGISVRAADPKSGNPMGLAVQPSQEFQPLQRNFGNMANDIHIPPRGESAANAYQMGAPLPMGTANDSTDQLARGQGGPRVELGYGPDGPDMYQAGPEVHHHADKSEKAEKPGRWPWSRDKSVDKGDEDHGTVKHELGTIKTDLGSTKQTSPKSPRKGLGGLFNRLGGDSSKTSPSKSLTPQDNSAVLQKLLLQQQQQAMLLSSKLDNLVSGPTVQIEDTLNPEFRKLYNTVASPAGPGTRKEDQPVKAADGALPEGLGFSLDADEGNSDEENILAARANKSMPNIPAGTPESSPARIEQPSSDRSRAGPVPPGGYGDRSTSLRLMNAHARDDSPGRTQQPGYNNSPGQQYVYSSPQPQRQGSYSDQNYQDEEPYQRGRPDVRHPSPHSPHGSLHSPSQNFQLGAVGVSSRIVSPAGPGRGPSASHSRSNSAGSGHSSSFGETPSRFDDVTKAGMDRNGSPFRNPGPFESPDGRLQRDGIPYSPGYGDVVERADSKRSLAGSPQVVERSDSKRSQYELPQVIERSDSKRSHLDSPSSTRLSDRPVADSFSTQHLHPFSQTQTDPNPELQSRRPSDGQEHTRRPSDTAAHEEMERVKQLLNQQSERHNQLKQRLEGLRRRPSDANDLPLPSGQHSGGRSAFSERVDWPNRALPTDPLNAPVARKNSIQAQFTLPVPPSVMPNNPPSPPGGESHHLSPNSGTTGAAPGYVAQFKRSTMVITRGSMLNFAVEDIMDQYGDEEEEEDS